MAQKYRKIDPRIWGDEKFQSLDPESQRVALYILTSPQGNRLGIFRFSLTLAAEDLKMDLGTAEPLLTPAPRQTLRECFANVLHAFDWLYDESARVLYLDTWWKYNPPENHNVLKGNLDDLHDLPETMLRQEFACNTRYLEETYHKTFRETLAARYGITSGETGTGTGARAGSGTVSGNTAAAAANESVLQFDTKEGGTWALTREKLAELAITFPKINAEQEAREAWQYLRDNPKKRGPAAGLPEFLRKWMKRSTSFPARSHPSAGPRSNGSSPSKSDQRRERNAAAVKRAISKPRGVR